MNRLYKFAAIAGFLIGAGCAETHDLASTAAEVRATMTHSYEQIDTWRVCGAVNPATGKREGDCEDFALCAIVGLRKRGQDGRVGVYRADGRCGDRPGPCYHAVAVSGDWVIDNGRLRPRGSQKFTSEWELRGDRSWLVWVNGKKSPTGISKPVTR